VVVVKKDGCISKRRKLRKKERKNSDYVSVSVSAKYKRRSDENNPLTG
jgi:hypothetical protein